MYCMSVEISSLSFTLTCSACNFQLRILTATPILQCLIVTIYWCTTRTLKFIMLTKKDYFVALWRCVKFMNAGSESSTDLTVVCHCIYFVYRAPCLFNPRVPKVGGSTCSQRRYFANIFSWSALSEMQKSIPQYMLFQRSGVEEYVR